MRSERGCRLVAVAGLAMLLLAGRSAWVDDLRFSESLIMDGYGYADGIAAADLDGDGDLDLTSADADNHSLYWFENDGKGNFTRHFVQRDHPKPRLERHVIADANQDGRPDVVIVENLTGDLLWFENSGTPAADEVWRPHFITEGGMPFAYDVCVADLDRDGDPDVAASGWTDNAVAWFENQGNEQWAKHIVDEDIAEARTIRAADFDRDGDQDLLATGSAANLTAWYENSGQPATEPWTKHVIDDQSTRPVHGHVFDMDGDGDADVLMALGSGAADYQGGAVVWYENAGKAADGPWPMHVVCSPFEMATEAVASDLDADGDLDVVATAWGENGRVVWFENSGDPKGQWEMHPIKENWVRANQVITADLNADGRPDIAAVAERGTNEFRWWRNEGTTAAAAAPPAAGQGGNDVTDIGSRLELFVDDLLIGTLTNVTQKLHHPVPREIALTFDAPWEGVDSGATVVFKDGDLYRFYYRGMHPDEPEVTCYAESRDGINWTKPNLGLFDYHGSTENNIIWKSQSAAEGGYSHNFAPFKDGNPAAPDSQRYKAVGGGGVLWGFVSPDGIHWTKIQEDPIITQGPFDTLNLAFWDSVRGQYICYMRDFVQGYRQVRCATSNDFINWTPAQPVVFGDVPLEHIYTNAVTPYFRAPHLFMGLPMRFLEQRTAAVRQAANAPGVSDGVFMTSRDGVHFHRWLEAFVRPGLDQGNWMQRTNLATWGMVPTSPEEISMYYSEHYYQPTNRERRYTLRTDGFVSIHAKYDGGELLTKPLTFEGRELVINYSTSAVGSVRVEIQDAAGAAIEGFKLDQCPEIFGDEIEHVVAWQGGTDVSALAGQPIRLRFGLKDCDLYSVQFRP